MAAYTLPNIIDFLGGGQGLSPQAANGAALGPYSNSQIMAPASRGLICIGSINGQPIFASPQSSNSISPMSMGSTPIGIASISQGKAPMAS
jgi:hypothetical protein